MIRTYKRELSVAAATAAFLILLAIAKPAFFSSQNVRDILVTKSYILVVAIGMTLVILARQIDISIGSHFAICGVAASLTRGAAAALLLEHIGQVQAARRIESAVRRTLQAGRGLTRDLGGDGTTATITAALIQNLSA